MYLLAIYFRYQLVVLVINKSISGGNFYTRSSAAYYIYQFVFKQPLHQEAFQPDPAFDSVSPAFVSVQGVENQKKYDCRYQKDEEQEFVIEKFEPGHPYCLPSFVLYTGLWAIKKGKRRQMFIYRDNMQPLFFHER